MNFTEKYSEIKDYFEIELNKKIDAINCCEPTLKSAMKYSLLNGGKRIRAVLMLAVSEVLSLNREDVLDFAVAIECIHAYSLIHDDLPAMDNDDFRRGKPTSHKVFGEAMAILAGDGLLNFAYEILLRRSNDLKSLSASRLLALYAGAFGMIGGQALDVLSEKIDSKNKSEDVLKLIHENKTGKLLTASVLIPSCLANNLYFDKLSEYGKNLGLLFQVVDDILDVTSTTEKLGKTANKDQFENKLTFVTLYGIEKSKQIANAYYQTALNSVKDICGSEFLIEILDFIKSRDN